MAFFETGKDVIGKKATHKTDEYITAYALQLFAAITLLPFVIISGIPPLKPDFWIAMVGLGFTIPFSALLYMKALKLSPLTLAIPMLAFNPIFTAVNAIIFDKKFPTPMGWIGILLVCVGLYIVRLSREVLKSGLFAPILSVAHEPGAKAMLGVALIWSIGAHLSKLAVISSGPLFAVWAGALLGTFILWITTLRNNTLLATSIYNHLRYLGPLGVIEAFSNLAMYTAFSTGLTAYVISIKRSNIVWSSLMGKLIFRESLNRNKILGISLMFVGIVMIII